MNPARFIAPLGVIRRTLLEFKYSLNLRPTLSSAEIVRVKSSFECCMQTTTGTQTKTLDLNLLNEKLGLRQSGMIQAAIQKYTPNTKDEEQGKTDSTIMASLKALLSASETNSSSPTSPPKNTLAEFTKECAKARMDDTQQKVFECSVLALSAANGLQIQSPEELEANHEDLATGNGAIRRTVTGLQGLTGLEECPNPKLNAIGKEARIILGTLIPLGQNRSAMKFSQLGTTPSADLQMHFDGASSREKEEAVLIINACFSQAELLYAQIVHIGDPGSSVDPLPTDHTNVREPIDPSKEGTNPVYERVSLDPIYDNVQTEDDDANGALAVSQPIYANVPNANGARATAQLIYDDVLTEDDDANSARAAPQPIHGNVLTRKARNVPIAAPRVPKTQINFDATTSDREMSVDEPEPAEHEALHLSVLRKRFN